MHDEINRLFDESGNALMCGRGTHSPTVVHPRGEVMGTLTEHDLVRALAEGLDLDRVTTREILTSAPRFITPR